MKNFAVPHPTRPGYTLRYSTLEGPEPGVFVRGTARLSRGRAVIRLPRHFALLASRRGLTCTVTARSARSRGVVVSSLSPSRVVVREVGGGSGTYPVDFTVFGNRKDQPRFRVVSRNASPQPRSPRRGALNGNRRPPTTTARAPARAASRASR